MKNILLLLKVLFVVTISAQDNNSKRSYKELMNDPSVNFYEVCKVADAHFASVDINAKGSGWKNYQRWKSNNEFKYFPSGERSNIDPFFVEKEYARILKSQPLAKTLYKGKWKELGPHRIDSISGHYSAGLGRIEDLAVSPNHDKLYVGSRSGGFWKSLDSGTTWLNTTDTLFASGVNAIAANPFNFDSVYINVRNAQNGTSHGIFMSTDGGTTWQSTPFNPANVGFGGLGSDFQIFTISYHPSIKNMVFVGTNQGLYKTSNNFQTFTRYLAAADVEEISFHPSKANVIYIANNSSSNPNPNQIILSTDTGATYFYSSVISGNNNARNAKLSVSNACDSCLYFATNEGVWKSTDEGVSFTFLSKPNVDQDGFSVNDLDTNYMIYGSIDVFGSSNGGRNFNQVTAWSLGNTNGAGNGNDQSYKSSTNYIHADLRVSKCIDGIFYVGTDGLICRSRDNGTSWENISEGLAVRENYRLGISQSNHYRSISGSQDNGTSIFTEKGWLEFYGADGMEGLVHPLIPDWMIGSLQNGGRRRTFDGGDTQGGVTPNGSSSGDWIAPIAYDPNNPMHIYDFRSSIYKSEDFAGTYSVIGAPRFISGNIQIAEIAQNNSDIIAISRNQYIEKSLDGGRNFNNIKSNLPNSAIQDIAFDPKNDNIIIVVYGSYQNDNKKVFMSVNGGGSWSNISYNLGNMPIRSVVIDHASNPIIYVGAEIGVYSKPLFGSTTWSLYNSGLPNTTVRELEINWGSNTLKAATWGRGLWEYNLLGRENYPTIMETKMSTSPSLVQPKESVPQYITSKIHYVGNLTSVYVEWSVNNNSLGNVIPMFNTVDSTWLSTSPIPNFPDSSKIYFKVFAVGANNDTTETYRFMYEVHEFKYCSATGNPTGSLYINNFTLNSYSNSTVNNGYSLIQSPWLSLDKNLTHTISISPSFSFGVNDFAAWIDFNRDAEFTPDERILYKINQAGVATDTFSIPSNVVLGDTLRLRARYSYQGTPDPCGYFDGEVEDYLVVVNSINVGIDKQSAKDALVSLYPNPNSGSFTLRFEKGQTQNLIQVFDIQGRLLIEKKQLEQEQLNIDSKLNPGTYYLKVWNNKGENVETLPLLIH